MTDLFGRTAIVTGGTRGLGKAITVALCRRGADVVVNHRSDSAAEVLAQAKQLPGTVRAVRADIGKPDGVRALLDSVPAGSLDFFIHNAAVMQPMSALAPDVAAFEEAMASSLGPLLYGAERWTGLLRQGGRLLAISSNGAGSTIPGYVASGVGKAALEAYMRYLAVELAPRGISVNTISTAMLDKQLDTQNAKVMSILASRTPGGHLSLPEDVADAVVLLCLPESHWIQGQVITADGGLCLSG
jgi:enoyl-[acyl-carrier protein] reductase III